MRNFIQSKMESVKGVATQDMGIDKEGNKKDSFEPGIELPRKSNSFC